MLYINPLSSLRCLRDLSLNGPSFEILLVSIEHKINKSYKNFQKRPRIQYYPNNCWLLEYKVSPNIAQFLCLSNKNT